MPPACAATSSPCAAARPPAARRRCASCPWCAPVRWLSPPFDTGGAPLDRRPPGLTPRGGTRRADGPVLVGSVPVVGLEVGPGRTGAAVPVLDVDQPGVDLPVGVRLLGDAGARPRRVEELRDAVRGARRVLRVRVP